MSERTGYAAIAAYYRRKIEDGELVPGQLLPSMREVCEQFGVAITTANRAFRQLKLEGLTVAQPGNGTVVADRPDTITTGADRLDRLNRSGKQYADGETSTDHTAVRATCTDPDIALMLDIEPGDEVVIRRRVFRKDGQPTTLGVSWIHGRALEHVPELLTQGSLKPFWQETYRERTGKEISRSPERRTARLATQEELDTLEISIPFAAAVPVLVLQTTFHDEDGPIEAWEDVYAPGLWQVDKK